ncbi:MAG: hypothetical protein HMLKMBBP_01657 [Planctomycetes bacterium]|nr:hypothetical protein [Planctomycetota bacterium]
MSPPTKVGIWLRVSTEDQVRGESPQHHEARARAYALSKGWEVATVYNLGGWSGKSVKDHPECKRMLSDVQSGAISALVFSKLARLARNTKELLDFADFFKSEKADLVSLQESIDTSSPAGRLFYTLIAAMAQWEREEIASRVAASVPVRAKLGKSLGGRAPYGYRWIDKKLVPNPDEVPVRRLVYDLFIEHRRKKTVARLLNEKGYRTREGARWSDTTIVRLIADTTAIGRHRLNYSRQTSIRGRRQLAMKPESEWVWQTVDPIISLDVWEQANAILRETRQNPRKPARTTRHLFTGLTFCHCGSKMYVPSRNPKYVCYACKNKIPVAVLEAVFREQLRGYLLSPTDLSAYLVQANGKLQEKTALVEATEVEVARLNTDLDRIMGLYLSGQLPQESVGERYRPIEARRNQLRDELPRLQGELDFLKISLVSSDEMIREAQDLYTHWGDLNHEEKRRIVEAITDRLTVSEGEIEINLCFRPSASETVTGWQRNHARTTSAASAGCTGTSASASAGSRSSAPRSSGPASGRRACGRSSSPTATRSWLRRSSCTRCSTPSAPPSRSSAASRATRRRRPSTSARSRRCRRSAKRGSRSSTSASRAGTTRCSAGS